MIVATDPTTINVKALLAVAKAAALTTASVGVSPIYESLHLDVDAAERKLVVAATNLELSSTFELDGPAVSATPDTWKGLVPAKALVAVLAKLRDDVVHLEWCDSSHVLRLVAGLSEFELAGHAGDNAPDIIGAKREEGPCATLTLEEIEHGVRRVGFAVSKIPMKTLIHGALIRARGGKLVMVGTDGRRIGVAPIRDTEGEFEAVVPVKYLNALITAMRSAAATDATLYVDRTHLTAAFAGGSLSSRMLEGRFPPYEEVVQIKGSAERCVVRRLEFRDALERVRVTTSVEASAARVHFSAQGIELKTRSQQIGNAQAVVSGTLDGAPRRVGGNVAYLIEALNALSGDEVTISWARPTGDVITTPLHFSDGSEDVNALMPVSVE